MTDNPAGRASKSDAVPTAPKEGSRLQNVRDISAQAREFARHTKPLSPLCGADGLRLPELLLPAGSPAALEAAIEAGGDAVYFGGRSFSARARAENFDDTEIPDTLRLCRAYGVRAYAAVNTRVRDTELDEAMRLVDLLADAGIDALITADLGLCELIKKRYGGSIELHASTQLTPVSSYDAKALSDFGFTRMVAPRELSLVQLSRLCEESPIEIEAFIHGAHCVSLSGQCLMSAVIGKRSANRGECAQPCRMNYSSGKEKGALLSLCDMCLAPDIPAVISSGVRSLKVEGCQKDAAYVYGVGRIYRRLLDERRSASSEEIEELAELFERGFTDGYLRGDYRAMRGVRRDDALPAAAFGGLSRRVACDARLTLREGEVPTLSLNAGGLSATASLDKAAERSRSEALTEDRAKKQIARLGNTPFELAGFTFDTDGLTWLAAADLNELRRRCVDKLLAPVAKKPASCAPGIDPVPKRSADFANRRAAQFRTLGQIPPSAFDYFDDIYLPYGEYGDDAGRMGIRLSLPPYMTDDIAGRAAELIRPGDRVLVHTVGQIAFVRSLGAAADLSFRLNVWNSKCARALCRMTDGFVTVSPEIPARGAEEISKAIGGAMCVAYGKLPVMYTVRCMIRDCAGCKGGPGGVTGTLRDGGVCRAYLTDRTGARFFTVGGSDCSNTIFNSVPTWTADKPIPSCGEYFIFSDESADEVGKIIAAYERKDPPTGKVRRVK